MKKNKNQAGLISFQVGFLCTFLGTIIIFTEFLIRMIFTLKHTVYDVVPADTVMDSEMLMYFALIPCLGLPSILLFLIFNIQFANKKKLKP